MSSPEVKPEIRLEIGHVLFTDIVGYSKLLITEQSEQIQKLKEIVRGTEQFRVAEAHGKLLRLPTGDGAALVFRTSPDAPVLCALEISKELKKHPELRVRMGIHSGPVNEITDLNEQANIAGAGINIAQRVMDCGDAGHILLSKHVADDLEQYPRWRPILHELGECEVKHGVRIGIVNLANHEIGNALLPKKFQATKKRRAHLRWAGLATALLILGATVGSMLFFLRRPIRSAEANVEKSIAVLPFENLSDEKENAYFADGIQEDLLTHLSKIKDIKVISRTSVMQYRAGITRNLRDIAQQLAVTKVVEGSVRRSGSHVRVSVQLIDARADRHMWAQNYDRTLADSISLQGELATAIAAQVGSTLSPQEKARVEAKPTNNAAAYEAYLRGRAFTAGVQLDAPNAEGAINSYQKAAKLDPGFTLAWAYLSLSQAQDYWIGHDPSSARLAAAKDALDHALKLDSNLPETHLALGYYLYYGERDFSGALAEFQRAEEGLPSNVDVIKAIGLIERRVGHWDEAVARLRRAVELDPRNVDAFATLAVTYTSLRRFHDVHSVADQVLAWDPTNGFALRIKANAFWATGDVNAVEPLLQNPGSKANPALQGRQALFQRRYPVAIKLLSNALADKLDDRYEQLLFMLALSQQGAGDVGAAWATYQTAVQHFQYRIENAKPDSPQEAELRNRLGLAYAGLGEKASAVIEVQRAIDINPSSKDALDGPTSEDTMARIYALSGDADHAIPILDHLLQIPYPQAITPALLRLDPTFDPLRNDPRFQKLAASAKPNDIKR